MTSWLSEVYVVIMSKVVVKIHKFSRDKICVLILTYGEEIQESRKNSENVRNIYDFNTKIGTSLKVQRHVCNV